MSDFLRTFLAKKIDPPKTLREQEIRMQALLDMARAIVDSLRACQDALHEQPVAARFEADPHAYLKLIVDTVERRHVGGMSNEEIALFAALKCQDS